MGDVAERPCVDEDRLMLERLHEVGFDRIAHHHRHRPGDAELFGDHGFAVVRRRHDHSAETSAEVLQIRCQREDRHDLGSRRDHELVLARDPVRLAAEADDRSTELAVVHVHRAWPGDGLGIDPERVAVEDRGVDRRGQEVVRRGDRVEVSVEVEVDVLHRHRYLLINAEKVVSKGQILDRVWNYEFGGDSRIVESYISYLRRKVDSQPPPLIHTIRGVGYLIAEQKRDQV